MASCTHQKQMSKTWKHPTWSLWTSFFLWWIFWSIKSKNLVRGQAKEHSYQFFKLAHWFLRKKKVLQTTTKTQQTNSDPNVRWAKKKNILLTHNSILFVVKVQRTRKQIEGDLESMFIWQNYNEVLS